MKKYLQKHTKNKYSDDWKTPSKIYDYFMENNFVDPCPYQFRGNNLDKDFGKVKLFINPPYSNIKSWVEFSINHHKKYKKDVILLVFARTDTKWFWQLMEYGIEVEFIKGRLKFNDGKYSAPAPSIYIKLTGVNK